MTIGLVLSVEPEVAKRGPAVARATLSRPGPLVYQGRLNSRK